MDLAAISPAQEILKKEGSLLEIQNELETKKGEFGNAINVFAWGLIRCQRRPARKKRMVKCYLEVSKTERNISLIEKEVKDFKEIQQLKKLYREHGKPHDTALSIAGDMSEALKRCTGGKRFRELHKILSSEIEKAGQHYDVVIRKLPIKYRLGDFLLGQLVPASAEEPQDRRALSRDLAKLLQSFTATLT